MHDLLAWICQTPRRFLSIASLIIIMFISGIYWSQTYVSDTNTKDSSISPISSSISASTPNSSAFVSAAVHFAEVWAKLYSGQTPAQWHAAVRALATSDLAAELDLTDTANLPNSAPLGTATVRYVSQTSALIAVPLASGSTILVTVVSSNGSCLVSDVQPDQGD